jgi:hypothetical protein
VDVTVRGEEKLAKIAGAVQRFAPDLRKELLREIRTGVKPILEEIRDEAEETLPRRGGLADLVAGAKYGVRTRTFGKEAGVRVEGRLPGHDINSVDRGSLRHPVFGRKSWVQQPVRPGFFSRPPEAAKPALQAVVLKAMDTVADNIRKASS